MSRVLTSSLALIQHHHMVGQPGDFVWRVADVEHRDFQLGGDFFQIGQDFLFAPQVQRRQRFVHQQELRRGEQRAANAHPLALAAR